MNLKKYQSIFWGLLFSVSAITSRAEVLDYFKQINRDPNALYAFFKAMPKGGDLHYHLAGGVYPEELLALAQKKTYCLNSQTLVLSKKTGTCEGIDTQNLAEHAEIYAAAIKAWSMAFFTAENESAHAHFFGSFGKFFPLVLDDPAALLALVIQRAADQNEFYLEVMDQPDGGQSIAFAKLLPQGASLETWRSLLLASPKFNENLKKSIESAEDRLASAYKLLDCDKLQTNKACGLRVNFLYYIQREQEKPAVFAQALTAFEAVSRSQGALIGVNLVQAEDGPIAQRDYHEQMLVMNFMHQHYPKVAISLHAGELTLESAPPAALKSHIYEALHLGHALRIGHGVSIAFEDEAEQSMAFMLKNQRPVEINLTSNRAILGVFGPKHPLHYYKRHGVPLLLSTDDEGILRTDLTQQYVSAVLEQGLAYQDIKNMNRNALTYSFLPGLSLWADPMQAIAVPACKELESKSCDAFIVHSEKARMQRRLEEALNVFEALY